MKIKISLTILTAFLLIGLVSAAISCNEVISRTGPTSVSPGQTFTVTYTATGTSGTWGATIQDTVSGGCSFPAGTTLKTVMLSDEGTTKSIQVTAPQSGTCTFTGDYQFGTCTIKGIESIEVKVSSSSNNATTTTTNETTENSKGGFCSFASKITFLDKGNCAEGTVWIVIGALILLAVINKSFK